MAKLEEPLDPDEHDALVAQLLPHQPPQVDVLVQPHPGRVEAVPWIEDAPAQHGVETVLRTSQEGGLVVASADDGREQAEGLQGQSASSCLC